LDGVWPQTIRLAHECAAALRHDKALYLDRTIQRIVIAARRAVSTHA
jgi:hypothetical protein